MNKNIGDMTNSELIDFIIDLQEENSRYERKIDKLELIVEQKEDIINKAIEFINKYNGSAWYQVSISIISELLELLDNKGKDI